MRLPVLTAALSLALRAAAYPSALETHEKRVVGILPGFNADLQRIDVSGDHAYVPADLAGGDIRGPCPGLNALANHAYLPHNGVGTIAQYIDATTTVFGMGADIAGFLAVFAAAIDGDGTSWSIGGPADHSLADAGMGLLGTPQGLSGSHNKYECDSSPTRGDLYQVGNDYQVQMENFQNLYDMQKDAAEPNYNLQVIGDFRSRRWDDSVQNNPYFFSGPFAGLVVSQAAFTFIYRFMANHTAEHPDGILDKETLKTFWGVSGPEDALVHTPGTERIPDNWYRRAIGDEYTIPAFNLDFDQFVLRYPKIASLGGNTGTTNSFAPLDVTNLTAGVMNGETLLQGDNAMCLAFQAAKQAQPDLLTGAATGGLVNQVAGAVQEAMKGLSCPQLEQIDESQFSRYPGYAKLKAGGVY